MRATCAACVRLVVVVVRLAVGEPHAAVLRVVVVVRNA